MTRPRTSSGTTSWMMIEERAMNIACEAPISTAALVAIGISVAAAMSSGVSPLMMAVPRNSGPRLALEKTASMNVPTSAPTPTPMLMMKKPWSSLCNVSSAKPGSIASNDMVRAQCANVRTNTARTGGDDRT